MTKTVCCAHQCRIAIRYPRRSQVKALLRRWWSYTEPYWISYRNGFTSVLNFDASRHSVRSTTTLSVHAWSQNPSPQCLEACSLIPSRNTRPRFTTLQVFINFTNRLYGCWSGGLSGYMPIHFRLLHLLRRQLDLLVFETPANSISF